MAVGFHFSNHANQAIAIYIVKKFHTLLSVPGSLYMPVNGVCPKLGQTR